MSIQSYTYTEFKDGFTEEFSAGSTSVTRVFDVAWPLRFAFVKDLLGYTTGARGNLQRVPPDRYPAANWLWASEASIGGIGQPYKDGNGVIAYTKARVTARYRALDYNPDPTVPWGYLSETFDLTGEFITLQQGTLQWYTQVGGQTQNVNEAPGLLLPGINYVQCWHQVPDFSFDPGTPYTYIGRVNQNPITVGKLNNLAVGALLFLGCEAHREFAADGSTCWTVTYQFQIRSQDHNKFLKPRNPPVWDFVQLKGSAQTGAPTPPGTIYPYDALENLWAF